MAKMQARQTVAAASTPAAITNSLGGRKEYWLLLDNPAYKSGITAYIVASATDAGPTGLAIPPRSQVLSGPYTDSLPYLYAARTQNIYVTVLGYAAATGLAFKHEISSMDTVEAAHLDEYTYTITHADLTAAAANQVITLPNFPANVFVSHGWVECDVDFSGGGAASCVAIVGDVGDSDGLVEAVSVFTGASNIAPLADDGTDTGINFEAAYLPLCEITANVNVVGLTAGQLTVHIVYLTCPFDA